MRNPSAKNHKAIWILSSLLSFLLSTAAYTCISQNQLCYYYFRQQCKEWSLISFHPLIYQPSVYSSIQVQKTHTESLDPMEKKFNYSSHMTVTYCILNKLFYGSFS